VPSYTPILTGDSQRDYPIPGMEVDVHVAEAPRREPLRPKVIGERPGLERGKAYLLQLVNGKGEVVAKTSAIFK
jgi:hypothetical protein